MDKYDVLTIVLSFIAIAFSWYANNQAVRANTIAENANRTNIKMFKRQGVIDLHMAWSDIYDIDEDNLITPHIVKAINALSLTASLWNHDVIEKPILYQSYWMPYKKLFDQIDSIDKLVPGKQEKCKDLLSRDIKKAYSGMNNTDLSKVLTTNL
ncbi:hypothetical protein [Maribacter stanieri]|uniref:Uncharacterized protein n=1 Tax=Maribacter stanieri TaxID=440514 RepID=A0A1I6IEY0_9FLAO|nr:hypothetical protein [Maribacter stanieri]SFR65194.1 hypothetical protein SAMN04488010_1582 [Maribacter stanieri]